MTSLDPFLSRTRPDWTGPTVFEQLVREAPFTLDILDPNTINCGQSLFKLGIIVLMRDQYTADTTI
jgi:hypothetical protein